MSCFPCKVIPVLSPALDKPIPVVTLTDFTYPKGHIIYERQTARINSPVIYNTAHLK